MLKCIKKHIDFSALQEEFRKIGVNFVAAGVVGVFIYHYVGTNLSAMLWTSGFITLLGLCFLYMGTRKRGDI